MRLDSHQHFWDPTALPYAWMPPAPHLLHRPYLPQDLQPILEANRFDGSIFVQATQVEQEAEWALALADAHPFVKGVVAWVDLRSRQLGARLDELQKHPRFVGVRHMIQDEEDPNWALQPDVLDGLRELQRRNIPYDVLVRAPQLHVVRPLADKLPDLQMVIDHIAKPLIKDQVREPWFREMEAIAQAPNTFVKLSGMITEADHANWTSADIAPYLQHAFRLWGPDRAMFGSDWPVCLLAGSWKQVLAAFTQALGAQPMTVREKLLGGTAAKFYRL